MGRPQKRGLHYFPLDVEFFEDRRIRRLVAKFGSDGAALYLYILCEAYSNGYYVQCTDDLLEDAAVDLNCSLEKIGLMLHYLLDKSLLDSKLFSTVKVLSSHGIQTQFQSSCKGMKREIEVDGNLWLLNEAETEGFIKVRQKQDISEKNPSISPKNTSLSGNNGLNKIKLNKNKLNNIYSSQPSENPPAATSGNKSAKVFDHDSEPYKAARYLARRISERLPNVKLADERKIQSWAGHIDKINRIDGFDWDTIADVLEFSQKDPFWQNNILGGEKFRKQFVQLMAKMGGDKR